MSEEGKKMLNSIDINEAKRIIIERARNLGEQLINIRGNDLPPFQPQEYTKLLPIKEITSGNLGELGAMLLRRNDGYVIKVNSNHHSSRQRFSLAHEIGHILFDELSQNNSVKQMEYRTFNPQASSIASSKDKEHLCDVAASELLMPRDVFIKYINDLGPSIESIEKLSKKFNVSLQSSAIRVAELSVKPCMVILWKLNPKDPSKTLNMAWHAGPSKNRTSREWFLPLNPRVRYPSSLHSAYQQEGITKCLRTIKTNSGNKRVPLESKGFGRNEARFVISLALVDN
jgi:Zn-dependent peptidase ImmA (M78 family)